MLPYLSSIVDNESKGYIMRIFLDSSGSKHNKGSNHIRILFCYIAQIIKMFAREDEPVYVSPWINIFNNNAVVILCNNAG